jgi:hypothetical protein
MNESERDGHNLAAVWRTMTHPAIETFERIFCGLFLHHLPGGVDDLKREFFKNVTNDRSNRNN